MKNRSNIKTVIDIDIIDKDGNVVKTIKDAAGKKDVNI